MGDYWGSKRYWIRYEIRGERAGHRFPPAGRLRILRSDECIQCGECISACIYGVHYREGGFWLPIGEQPQDRALCRECLKCIRECPVGALSADLHPDWVEGEGGEWNAERVFSILKQAADGKIPVSGAGYGGVFSGKGFDALWTDMSEIVRPTRDGIHGREYISTVVDIGRKLPVVDICFPAYPVYPVPLPVVVDGTRLPLEIPGLRDCLLDAVRELDTLILLPVCFLPSEPEPHIVPVLEYEEWVKSPERWEKHPGVELRKFSPGGGDFSDFRGKQILFVESPPEEKDMERLAREKKVGCILLRADREGRLRGAHLIDVLYTLHRHLVELGIRDEVSIGVGGGIASAEHIPKTIIRGADFVLVDEALLVALQIWDGKRWYREPVEREWGKARIKNLMKAWRDQLLEVLGAMGMREVRRLRGEVGRSMRYEELEEEFRQWLREPVGIVEEWERRGEVAQSKEAYSHKPAPPNFRLELGKYKVRIGRECIRCRLCVDICPEGVFDLWEGVHKVQAVEGYRCIGGNCQVEAPEGTGKSGYIQGYPCVKLCPVEAIRIEEDSTYRVMGDRRWTGDLLIANYLSAEKREVAPAHVQREKGESGGGFDRLIIVSPRVPKDEKTKAAEPELAIPLNRRGYGEDIWIPVPWYGGGMSFGSVSLAVMLARAKAAKAFGTFVSTGEGGFPEELDPYKEHIITQIATGLFGVREDTIQKVRVVEFKYAQGAKPGLGGHLLADKVTASVARMREAVQWTSLFSPFPFHSVYSVEDHKKHLDWIRVVNPRAVISVKVSTPSDVDMVAIGSYYAGAHIFHIDGGYGGTGAAPEIAKKNIATPLEYAIPKVHRYLVQEGVRDEMVLMASGGIRTAWDIAKAIALGADGVVLGTAELVALECNRCGNCESGRGCPFGIATTDEELSGLIDPDWGAQRIINLFATYAQQLRQILSWLGLSSIRELRGRTDLLRIVGEGEAETGMVSDVMDVRGQEGKLM
ncbi:MAG: glutamate synthase-related protein [bacterium JZ-2024 1]